MDVGKWDSVSRLISRMDPEYMVLPKLLYLLCLNFYIDLHPSVFFLNQICRENVVCIF